MGNGASGVAGQISKEDVATEIARLKAQMSALDNEEKLAAQQRQQQMQAALDNFAITDVGEEQWGAPDEAQTYQTDTERSDTYASYHEAHSSRDDYYEPEQPHYQQLEHHEQTPAFSGYSIDDDSSYASNFNVRDQITHMAEENSSVAEKTTEQLFQILPFCGTDETTAELVRNILNSTDIFVEQVDDSGNTLLLVAAQRRNEEVVDLLVNKKNANVNAVNSMGATPLHFACTQDSFSVSIAEKLIKRNAKLDVQETSCGCVPLHYAAACADVTLVETLLKYGANPCAKDNDGYMPEEYAEQAQLTSNVNILRSAREAWEAREAKEWELLPELLDEASGHHYRHNPRTGETRWVETEIAAASPTPEKAPEAKTNSTPAKTPEKGPEAASPTRKQIDLKNLDQVLEADERAMKQHMTKMLNRAELVRRPPLPSAAVDAECDNIVSRVLAESSLDKAHIEEWVDTPSGATPVGLVDLLSDEVARGLLKGNKDQSERFVTSVAVLQMWLSATFAAGCRRTAQRLKGGVTHLVERYSELKNKHAEDAKIAQQKISESEAALARTKDEAAVTEQQLTAKLAAATQDQSEMAAQLSQQLEQAHSELKQVKQEKAELAQWETKAKAAQTELEQMKASLEDTKQKMREQAAAKAQQDVLHLRQECETMVARAKLSCQETVEAITKKNDMLKQRWLQEQAKRRKYFNELEDLKGKIRVFARVRPLSNAERQKDCKESIVCKDKFSCEVQAPSGAKLFEFDRVFSPDSTQAEVFHDTKLLVQTAVDGFNVCIFAYGQTGSGKTYTMMGEDSEELLGISPRAINELFCIIKRDVNKFDIELSVSMYELYRDNLVDLLWERASRKDKPPPLKISTSKGDGRVVVEGGVVLQVDSLEQLCTAFGKGMSRRHTSATKMNDASSRSHLVQQIFITATNKDNKVATLGKLTLVDLAGSERQSKTGATGEVFKEAMSINKSLSALGNVISALTSGSKHIPYRDSVLTELMRDCLGGNAKTLMFVNLSPADYNLSEGMSSLNFGRRCKKVTNKATAAVESHALKKLRAQLQKLQSSDDKNVKDSKKKSGRSRSDSLALRRPLANAVNK